MCGLKTVSINKKEQLFLDGEEIQKACICIAIHLDSFRQQDKKNKIADFGEPCLLCPYARDCNLDWLSVMEPVLSKAPRVINIAEDKKRQDFQAIPAEQEGR